VSNSLIKAEEIKSFEKYKGEYNYQTDLTISLDLINDDFSQEIINEIVLWKVNRYAKLNTDTLNLLNSIKKDETQYTDEFVSKILDSLLNTKGIKIAMASTILRFKNPNYFQIIDQRVYRILYGEKISISTKIENVIKMYIDYLRDLKIFCKDSKILFIDSDRTLYLADKDVNKDIKLDN